MGTQPRFPPENTCIECIENTLQVIQSTFRSLEMHSKRRYKILYLFGHPRAT